MSDFRLLRNMEDPPDEMWEIGRREAQDTLGRCHGFFLVAICDDEEGDLEAVVNLQTGPDMLAGQMMATAVNEAGRIASMILESDEDSD